MSRKRLNNEKLAVGKNKRRNIAETSNENDEAHELIERDILSDDSPINRSGKINRIILKNFMCHSNLVVDFNKNVTLLVGNNGSGKSAVLTALIVGLGSKSSTTNRCTNIAQLIKRGETAASVTIYIANNCEQGYERDTFGSQIIVQRSFTKDGTSTYKIRKANNQIVSSSRKDLLKILLFMNIQVDNPVCVLNQDASRAFLKESDPKKRFKFFLKATQIDTVIEKLNDCHIHYINAKKQLEYQNTLLISLKKEIDNAQSKYDSLQSIVFFKKSLSNCKLESAWLKVENEEKLHEEITRTLSEYQRIYDDIIKNLSDQQNSVANRRAKCELLKQQINALRNELQSDLDRKEHMQRNMSGEEESINETKRQLNKVAQKMKNNESNVKQLEKDMSESTESQMTLVAQQKLMNEKKLETLRRNKGEIESLKSNVSRDIEMSTNTKRKFEEDVNQLHDKRNAYFRTQEKLNAQIRQCETSKNSLSVYGHFMPELVNTIETMYQKGDFQQLPLGPLGKYIEVTDQKWKAPVEGILGAKLMSFCVNDAKDRETLNRLIKKLSTKFPDIKKCTIITTKFTNQLHNIRKGKVQSAPNSYCVLDVIKCNEAVIVNTLIDYCKIEKILLTEDEQTSFNITSNVENVPQKLLKVICTNPPTEIFPAPMLRSYALKTRPARYLQVNMKQRKDYLENELNQIVDQIKEINKQIMSEEEKKKDLSTKIPEMIQRADKFDDNLRNVLQAIKQIERIEYPGENEKELLQNELDELKQIYDNLYKEHLSIQQRLDQLQSTISIKRNEISAVNEDINKKNDKIQEKELEILAENQLRSQNSVNKTYNERKAAELKVDLEKCEEQQQDCSKKLTTLMQSASNHGERVPITNSHEVLAAKIKETEKIIKTVSESKESLEYVQEKLQLKTSEYENKKELIENLAITISKLKTSRQRRYQWLIKFKSHVSLRVQHEFNRIMKLRNYNGTITINHQKELLELSVVPRDSHIANSVSSANCLSGGERSFSTVAFLLALWSVVDSPFYFLDEYDVYTDAVNRYYMTKLLLFEAKKKQHRQYTFLTPQDTSEITPSSDVSIQRLADPIRK